MAAHASGPFVPGMVNTQLTPLFARRSWAPAAALGPEVTFFGDTAGVGGIGPEITNMTRAFELPAPTEFTVHAMRCCFYDTTSADIMKICKAYTMQLIVGGNVLLSAPPDYWTAASGVTTLPNNGIADPRARQETLPHPIYIPSGTGFSVRWIGTSQTVTAATFVAIYLDGPLSKPVS